MQGPMHTEKSEESKVPVKKPFSQEKKTILSRKKNNY